MNTPEKLETELEREQPVEKKLEVPEVKDEHYDQGIEMLENPHDNNFQQALQVFIAWVKTLLADDK
ncbi:MAG: hypothetical protein WDN47_01255 [Candidatus Doudnabacteria bacterium]